MQEHNGWQTIPASRFKRFRFVSVSNSILMSKIEHGIAGRTYLVDTTAIHCWRISPSIAFNQSIDASIKERF